MRVDEAIKHAREKAEEQRKDNDTCVVKEGYGCKDCAYYYSKSCIECAEEHEQLAEWLEELKNRRQTNFNHVQLMDCRYRDGYRKAIDDITERIAIYGTYDDYGNVVHVLEIAEKLKKECAE